MMPKMKVATEAKAATKKQKPRMMPRNIAMRTPRGIPRVTATRIRNSQLQQRHNLSSPRNLNPNRSQTEMMNAKKTPR